MMNILLFILILLAFFGLVEFLQRKLITRMQWSRKAMHVGGGIIALFFPNYLTVSQILLICGIFSFLLVISKLLNLLTLHSIKRESWGEVIYPISIFFLAIICLPQNYIAFYIAVLCLTFSDTAAEIFGKMIPIKKIRLGKHRKSIGGFIGFTITTIVIFCIFFPLHHTSFYLIISTSVILGIIELLSLYGTDNFTVPVMASLFVIWWF